MDSSSYIDLDYIFQCEEISTGAVREVKEETGVRNRITVFPL